MDRDLQTLLLKDNPWIVRPDALATWFEEHLPSRVVPRTVLDEVARGWSSTRRAHLVIGPRQAGKSTLIWAHLASQARPVLHVDCEQALVRDWCRSAPLFLDDLGKLVSSKTPLFFDEVQHLAEAGLFIKGLVDRRHGAPIFVTGSSSFHLGAKTRESLAGRATRLKLLPFSLQEVCHDVPLAAVAIRQRTVEDRLRRHLIYGGYPEAWLAAHPEPVLLDLVEACILRDASDLFNIARPDSFRQLLRLMAGQVGSLVNLSEWASLLGISRSTVASYIEILGAGHIVVELPPFAGGKRSELTGRSKIFFIDNGIRNQLVGDFRTDANRLDRGPLLENWAFSELWKRLPSLACLRYWRSTAGAEVDFVVENGKRLLGIEVKAQSLARPKLSRSSRSFIEAYGPARFVVINESLRHDLPVGDVRVMFRRPWELTEALEGE